jgi:hypothetical protein
MEISMKVRETREALELIAQVGKVFLAEFKERAEWDDRVFFARGGGRIEELIIGAQSWARELATCQRAYRKGLHSSEFVAARVSEAEYAMNALLWNLQCKLDPSTRPISGVF